MKSQKYLILFNLKVFEGKKNKNDCIVHFMQLPIKENVQFKIFDSKGSQSKNQNQTLSNNKDITAISDISNPIISQVKFNILKNRLSSSQKCLSNSQRWI